MRREPPRIRIQWTAAALEGMKSLPKKVRKGLFDKADQLQHCDPRDAHKPLVGPLAGCYRITYGRYRAVYRVIEEEAADGDVRLTLLVLFIAVGIRREQSRSDVYRIARKIVDYGVLDLDRPSPPDGD